MLQSMDRRVGHDLVTKQQQNVWPKMHLKWFQQPTNAEKTGVWGAVGGAAEGLGVRVGVGLQHVRLPCPSLSPRVCSNSYSLSH